MSEPAGEETAPPVSENETNSKVLISKPDKTDQLTLEHQGVSKICFQPGGEVVWELGSPDGHVNTSNGCVTAREALKASFGKFAELSLMFAGGVGVMTTMTEIADASRGQYCLTSHCLTRKVADTVSSYLAGTLTGIAYGPFLAVRSLGVKFARPALLAIGVGSLLRCRSFKRSGASALVFVLRNGCKNDRKQALHKIEARASDSKNFRSKFYQLGGVQLLLGCIYDFPDAESLGVITKALSFLARNQDCKEAIVQNGGIRHLVGLLEHANGSTVAGSLTTLSAFSDHTLALEDMRAAGGVPILIRLLENIALSALHWLVVSLLRHLSVDPVVCVQLSEAGGVNSLMKLMDPPSPRTQVKEQAVVVLYNVLRSSNDNASFLTAELGTFGFKRLQSILSEWGVHWYPCKPDLHALLNKLSYLQN